VFENVQTVKPISAEQLVAAVKGIYAGLIMVEQWCCNDVSMQYVWLNNEKL